MNPDEVNPQTIMRLGNKVESLINDVTRHAELSGDRDLMLLCVELNQLQTEFYTACYVLLYKLRHRHES